MDLDEKDILEALEKKEEPRPEPPGLSLRVGAVLDDYKYLLSAIGLELVLLLLIKVKSHRWLLAAVLVVLWFAGLCLAAAELFSDSMVRRWLAFFVLVSYLYVFYRLFLFIVTIFA